MKHFIFLLIFFVYSPWGLSRDLNFKFIENYLNPSQEIQLPQGVGVFWASGFLGDLSDWLGYFHDMEEFLQDRGVEVVRSNSIPFFDTEDSVMLNALKISQYLQGRKVKKWLILSNSKGSLETLHALLSLRDRSLIYAWISIQGAFGGSPIADSIRPGAEKISVNGLLNLVGGSFQSIKELKTQKARSFLKENEPRICQLIDEIPVLTFSSWINPSKTPKELSMMQSLFVESDVFQRRKSDGMILLEDAQLPCAPNITVEGFDHIRTGRKDPLDSSEPDVNRSRLLRSLIQILQELISENQSTSI